MIQKAYSSFTNNCSNCLDMGDKTERFGMKMEIEMKMKLDNASRLSDWEARPLFQFQLNYAASDSMALVDLYHSRLEKEV